MCEEVIRVSSEVSAAERPTISLHLLVKNGAGVVGRLIDCVGPYIQEVVAVLNDCEDDTPGVLADRAMAHGLRLRMCPVTSQNYPELYILDVPATYRVGSSLMGEEMPADHTGRPLLADFAGARNVGWGKHICDWRLFLDADDVVEDPGNLPGLCALLGARGVEAAASRYHVGSGAGGVRERLALNRPHIRWLGAAHERLVGFEPTRVVTVEGSLVVRDMRDSAGKDTRVPWRNLKVLYHAARSLDWEITSREMVYLASEAREIMPSFAAYLAERCDAISSWNAERAWACEIRGMVAEGQGSHPEASKWYERSMLRHPTRSAASRLIRSCYCQKRWNDVLDAYERLIDLGDVPTPIVDGEGVDGEVVESMVVEAVTAVLGSDPASVRPPERASSSEPEEGGKCCPDCTNLLDSMLVLSRSARECPTCHSINLVDVRSHWAKKLEKMASDVAAQMPGGVCPRQRQLSPRSAEQLVRDRRGRAKGGDVVLDASSRVVELEDAPSPIVEGVGMEDDDVAFMEVADKTALGRDHERARPLERESSSEPEEGGKCCPDCTNLLDSMLVLSRSARECPTCHSNNLVDARSHWAKKLEEVASDVASQVPGGVTMSALRMLMILIEDWWERRRR